MPEIVRLHQIIDLLRSANLLAGLRLGSGGPRLTWRLLDAKGVPLATLPGPLAAYTHSPAEPHNGPPCAVFIPSFHAADIPAIRSVVARNQPLVRQVGIARDAGQKVFTLGNGAWLAAGSGRSLSGRQVSLPWFYVAGFERDHPDTGFALGQDIAEDGLWISGALPLSVGDLAVALVRHTLGSELAQACASVLAPDHERTRAALQANAQQHIPATRDSTLARAIAWMEAHLDEPYSLARLAEAAAVSPRTLLRHFQQELSQSPLDHLHGLRCARAKVLLEVTLESVHFLAKIGLVTHKSLWRFNRWFVVIAFILGAVLTPSADPISQCLMALPMIALYNLSIIVAWLVVRNKRKQPGYEAMPDEE